MGITGLIPFLEKSSSRINVKDLHGYSVAIDTYCWLHKGAFACADLLARGEQTDIHIQYCLKYVSMLLSFGIKPILVFDGRHLPAKEITEKKRRQNRKVAKSRAVELLRLGKQDEARSFFRRCVDITHEMALQLIKECRKINVDCIVAPYEADAQLAFLNLQDIAQYVITEDSDLVLFGCKKILFKLDLTGSCLMVDADKLYLSMGCRPEKFTFNKFMYMCILSGCDYVDSLPGIGLAKACKFVLTTEDNDIRRALGKIPAYLNMRHLVVTEEYKDNFLKAAATFRHMFVYDPVNRELTRLSDPELLGTDIQYCCNAGTKDLDDETYFQMALGNVDPFSLKILDNWHPDDNIKLKITVGRKTIPIAKHTSIWKSNFKPFKQNSSEPITDENKKVVPKNLFNCARSLSPEIDELTESEDNLLAIYGYNKPSSKRLKLDNNTDNEIKSPTNLNSNKFNRNPFIKIESPIVNEHSSPTKLDRHNTSLLKNTSPVKRIESPQKRLPKLSKFKRTDFNPDQMVVSRFFQRNLQTDFTKTENNDFIEPAKMEQIEDVERNHKNNLELSSKLYLNAESDDIDEDLGSVDCDIDDKITNKIDLTAFSFRKCDKFDMYEDEKIKPVDNKVDSSMKHNPIAKINIIRKQSCRQPGLSKNKQKSSDPTQSRLSMFGFKKKKARQIYAIWNNYSVWSRSRNVQNKQFVKYFEAYSSLP